MPFQRLSRALSIGLPVAACALALALGGCVAAPLAQMAITQMTPKPTCLVASGCQTGEAAGSFGDISKGLSDSFRKLTSLASDSQPVAPQVPAK
jgi:hypothetical protein